MRRWGVSLHEILRLCLLDGQDDEVATSLQRIVAGGTLAGLSAAAHDHGVPGYVLDRLKHVAPVDGDALQTLRTLHERAVGAHLQSLADLAVLAAACDPERADWAAAGGPLIAELVHAHPGLRMSGTVDVVVSDRAFSRVLKHTAEAGCRLLDPDIEPSCGIPHLATLVMPHGSRARLLRRVVLGRGNSRHDEAAMDALLSRTRIIDLRGPRIRALNWEDTLFLLASRLDADSGARLGWLKDIQRVIACHPPDWNNLAERAREFGRADLLKDALRAARDTLAAAVPDGALEALESAGTVRAHAPMPDSQRRKDLSESQRAAAAMLLRAVRLQPRAVQPLPATTWEEMLALAGRERLAPLVHEALRAQEEANAPRSVGALLAHIRETTRAHVARAYGELSQVLAVFRKVGRTPVLMKGAALARFTYADPALRPFADLDLLVPLPEVSAAHQALRQAGYVVAGDVPTDADLIWRHGRGYYDPDGIRMPVDLHWRFVGYPLILPLDRPGIFQRATEVLIEGEPALLPAAGDLVVAACISFLRECWYRKPRLRYLRDLAEIATRHSVDWDLVTHVVCSTPPLRSPAYFALAAAADLLDAPIPAPVLGTLRPRRSPAIVRRLRAYTASRAVGTDRPLRSLLQVALMRWMDSRSTGEFLRWVRELVLVPPPLAESQRRWLQMLRER